MNRLSTIILNTIALLFLGVALPSGDAVAQQKTLKEQIVGTWTYVAVDTVGTDSSRVPIYGPNPQGVASFDSNGVSKYRTPQPTVQPNQYRATNGNPGLRQTIPSLG